jgi:SAM-dependent methyltransferase
MLGSAVWVAPDLRSRYGGSLWTNSPTVVATDLNDETLQVARTRSYGPAEVSFRTADAYDLGVVPGSFDAIFAGFFWSHVLRADVQRFVRGLQNRLAPGGIVILADNRYVEGSNHPITRVGEHGDTYQTRRLADGREFEILKNFPTRAQFTADLVSVTPDVRWTDLDYFWLAEVSLA